MPVTRRQGLPSGEESDELREMDEELVERESGQTNQLKGFSTSFYDTNQSPSAHANLEIVSELYAQIKKHRLKATFPKLTSENVTEYKKWKHSFKNELIIQDAEDLLSIGTLKEVLSRQDEVNDFNLDKWKLLSRKLYAIITSNVSDRLKEMLRTRAKNDGVKA